MHDVLLAEIRKGTSHDYEEVRRAVAATAFEGKIASCQYALRPTLR